MDINWDEAPEGFDYALTTDSDWNGAPEYKGTIRFAKKRENSTYFECREGRYPLVGRGCWVVVATRPKQWNGEGMPPVGTICECQDESFQWHSGTIVHVGQGDGVMVAVMQTGSGILIGEKGEFRPLRTPEQIAAEERESEVSHIERCITNLKVEHQNNPRVIAEVLHNIGYRKQENNDAKA